MIEENINAVFESLVHLRNGILYVIARRYVGLDEKCLTPIHAYFIGKRSACLFLNVKDSDIRTLTRKYFRCRAANPGGTAGNYYIFSLESFIQYGTSYKTSDFVFTLLTS